MNTVGDLYDSLPEDHPFRRYVDKYDLSVNRQQPIYPDKATAQRDHPSAYREVCTQWGRAGYGHNSLPLPDGRKIAWDSVWWEVPEPGGRTVAHYFA